MIDYWGQDYLRHPSKIMIMMMVLSRTSHTLTCAHSRSPPHTPCQPGRLLHWDLTGTCPLGQLVQRSKEEGEWKQDENRNFWEPCWESSARNMNIQPQPVSCNQSDQYLSRQHALKPNQNGKTRSNLSKGSLRIRKVHFFFVQKSLWPPPPPFRLNIYVVNFSGGNLTQVRKRLSQQLSTK